MGARTPNQNTAANSLISVPKLDPATLTATVTATNDDSKLAAGRSLPAVAAFGIATGYTNLMPRAKARGGFLQAYRASVSCVQTSSKMLMAQSAQGTHRKKNSGQKCVVQKTLTKCHQ